MKPLTKQLHKQFHWQLCDYIQPTRQLNIYDQLGQLSEQLSEQLYWQLYKQLTTQHHDQLYLELYKQAKK